jgi:hypothetical protein
VATATAARQSGFSGEDGYTPDRTGGMWIRVLGPIGLWRDGAELDLGGSKQRAVFGLLAAKPDSIVHE